MKIPHGVSSSPTCCSQGGPDAESARPGWEVALKKISCLWCCLQGIQGNPHTSSWSHLSSTLDLNVRDVYIKLISSIQDYLASYFKHYHLCIVIQLICIPARILSCWSWLPKQKGPSILAYHWIWHIGDTTWAMCSGSEGTQGVHLRNNSGQLAAESQDRGRLMPQQVCCQI